MNAEPITCAVCGELLTLEMERDDGVCVDCLAEAASLPCPVVDVFERAMERAG